VLVLLDAMKMYNEICATITGRVREVLVNSGDTVQKDQLLVSLRRSESQ
jgi:biotin carboxyl carrier protein